MKKSILPFSILLVCAFIFPASFGAGAKEGLNLWFGTVLPNLFPYLLITNILSYLNGLEYLSSLLAPPLKKIFGVRASCCYSIFIGFFCGYPMGAKAVADSLKQHLITRSEAQYLLAFCNNVSPIYIMNYIILASFKDNHLMKPMLVILLTAPVIYSFVYRIGCRLLSKEENARPIHILSADETGQPPSMMDSCIMSSFELMFKIGGYIIFFSIIGQLITQLPIHLPVIKYFLIGLMEMTIGIAHICSSSLSLSTQIVLVCILTTFGGLSTTGQTYSIIHAQGLSVKEYSLHKVGTALIAGLLAFTYTNIWL